MFLLKILFFLLQAMRKRLGATFLDPNDTECPNKNESETNTVSSCPPRRELNFSSKTKRGEKRFSSYILKTVAA